MKKREEWQRRIARTPEQNLRLSLIRAHKAGGNLTRGVPVRAPSPWKKLRRLANGRWRRG